MQPSSFTPGTFFDRFFHASPVAMSVTDPAGGRYLDVNQAFARLVDVDRPALLNNPNGADEQPFQFLFGQPSTGAPACRRAGLLRTARGELHDVIASSQSVERQGLPFRLTIIQDLTAIKQSEVLFQTTQARFRLFFDSVPLPVFVYDMKSRRILDLNPAAARHYGYTREEMLALDGLAIRPGTDYMKFLDYIQAMPPETTQLGVWPHTAKDGTLMTMEVTGYALELDDRVVRLSVCRDVTEQLRMEAALQASEKRHRIIAEVTNDVLWDIDFMADSIVFSEGMTGVFGYTLTQEVPVEWWVQHIHPTEREAVRVRFDAAVAGHDIEWTDTYRFLRLNGTYAHVRDRGHIFRDENGAAVRMIGAMIDITRQIEVREAEAQAAMEERRRLARDLHDAVTQSLYSLSLLAEVARRRAEQGDMKAITEGVNRLGELAQQSLKEMRLLVHELRPLQLQKEGLAAALQARLDTVERHSGVRAHFVAELGQKLSSQVQLQYYRVAEEALNNALKHAAASAVWVTIRSGDGTAALEISDNGKGFDPTAAVDSRGMGLTNMRERMEKLGGRLEIDSSPGTGTTIRAITSLGDETHGKRNSDTYL